ncbi:hypothetical protein [Roseibium limicola]|uniref:Uncharacterized protein n=1 Tax=Roseibium limicola TaxID=2816037 RepID=A0A939J9Y6_9HYPH|nr:hypothetical protein [Roseibium limicola]MBO0346866.1 hypothetical protein [Roseibium limicola]
MDIDPLWFAGGLLMLLAALTILFKRDISSGQALIFAFGGALIALPQVADFQLTDGGIKFTTREESGQLTEEVASVTDQQLGLAQTVASLTEKVELLQTQLETAQAAPEEFSWDGATRPPTPAPLVIAPSLPNYATLKQENQDIIDRASRSLKNLNTLQDQIEKGS